MQQGTQHLRRRQLLIAAAGAASAPLALMHNAAFAQTATRRLGMLIGDSESDPTAKTLGLKIPYSVMVRADRVIE